MNGQSSISAEDLRKHLEQLAATRGLTNDELELYKGLTQEAGPLAKAAPAAPAPSATPPAPAKRSFWETFAKGAGYAPGPTPEMAGVASQIPARLGAGAAEFGRDFWNMLGRTAGLVGEAPATEPAGRVAAAVARQKVAPFLMKRGAEAEATAQMLRQKSPALRGVPGQAIETVGHALGDIPAMAAMGAAGVPAPAVAPTYFGAVEYGRTGKAAPALDAATLGMAMTVLPEMASLAKKGTQELMKAALRGMSKKVLGSEEVAKALREAVNRRVQEVSRLEKAPPLDPASEEKAVQAAIQERVFARGKTPEPVPWERQVGYGEEPGVFYGPGGEPLGQPSPVPKTKPSFETGEKKPIPFIFSPAGNIRRMNPQLYDRLIQWSWQKDVHAAEAKGIISLMEQKMRHAWRDEIAGKKGEEAERIIYKNLADMVEGRRPPQNALESDILVDYKSVFNTYPQEIDQLAGQGVPLYIYSNGERFEWRPRENYFPRAYLNLKDFLKSIKSPDHMQKAASRFAQVAFPAEYGVPETRATAIEKAANLLAGIRKSLGSMRAGHLEQARVLPDEVVEALEKSGLLQRDYSRSLLNSYIEQAENRLAWLRNLGPDLPADINEMNIGRTQLPEAWREAIATAEHPAQREYLVKQLLTMSGRRKEYISKFWDILNLISTPKMIFSSPANATQWLLTTVPMQAIKDIPGTMWDTIKANFGNTTAREFYRLTGLHATPADIARKVGDNPQVLEKAQQLFYKLMVFTTTERGNAQYAAFGGGREALRLADKLMKNPTAWRAGAWEEKLRNLGIDNTTIQEIKNKTFLAPEQVDKILAAAWNMKRITQFMSDPLFRPLWMSNPQLRKVGVTKFKLFPMSMVQYVIDQVLTPAGRFLKTAGRQGDITPLLKIPFTAGLAGYLATEFKKRFMWGLVGKKDIYDRFLEDKPLFQKWLFWASQAGTFGIYSDLVAASSADKMALNMAGPIIGDVVNVIDTIMKNRQHVIDAWDTKNPQILKDRAGRIGRTIVDLVSRMQPGAKFAFAAFLKDYAAARDIDSWERVLGEATHKYMNLCVYGGPTGQLEADQFWMGIQSTYGAEYQMIRGKPLEPPDHSPEALAKWAEMQSAVYPELKPPKVKK